MQKPVIECYLKKGCCLCTEAEKVIGRVNADIPFSFRVVDISTDEDLFRRYANHVPVVFINGKKSFKFKVDETEFRRRIRKEIIKEGISRLNDKGEFSAR